MTSLASNSRVRDTVIRCRARVGEGVRERHALPWRLRLASLLDSVQLRPTGLPPAAVFLVRRLSSNLPESAARVTSTAERLAWARSVRSRLDELHRTSVRPKHGRVPSGAAAVVFADEAEWLACTLVAIGRRERAAWWWSAELRRSIANKGPEERLAEILLGNARIFPAIAETLARWNCIVAIGRVFSPAAAEKMLGAVLALERTSLAKNPEAPTEERVGVYALASELATPQDATQEMEIMAWADAWLPSNEARALSSEQVALIVAARAVYTRPAWFRRSGLSVILIKQIAARMTSPPFIVRPSSPEETRAIRSRNMHREAGEPAAPADPATPPSGPNVGAPASGTSIRKPVLGGSTTDRETGTLEASKRHSDNLANPGIPDSPSFGVDVAEAGSEPEAHPSSPAVSTPHEEGPQPSVDGGIATELGGVFYLLNLFAAMDVAACFNAWRLRGSLGPWELIEVVARALLDDQKADLCHDPLWRILATLDGREPSVGIGEGIEGKEEVQIPTEWVAGELEAESAWAWARAGGQLCVWRMAGAPVAVIPSTSEPLQGARDVLNRLGVRPARLTRRPFASAPLPVLDGPLTHGIVGELLPWLRVVVPFLKDRLERALGDGIGVADALRVPGVIHLTSSHVDVVQPLDCLPLAVRRAGLDRDPGWLPAFGRVVHFHFESQAREF